jgi:hypothetical protein
MASGDSEIDRLESDEAWDKKDQVVDVSIRRPLDRVVPVRIASHKWEELRREARELGIGPTTLARMWILEKLRESRTRQSTA